MKVTRNYALTDWLVTQTANKNRSDILRRAVMAAMHDPSVLVRALEHRVRGLVDTDGSNRIGVTMEISLLEPLDELAKKVALPIEHVLRLAMEDYLSHNK